MHFRAIQRIIGVLLMLFSLTMLPPAAVAWIYDENMVHVFMVGFLTTLITGVLLWLLVRGSGDELKLRDGFMVVVLFWVVLGIFGALPFVLAKDLDIVDAVFESMSGLTTTGATVIVGLDDLPHALLYYRQQLQWLGGMGIIVLAVAILPMLGIGGMQLYRAETPGPMKDTKLTPRITETAKALWYIYLSMTVLCAGFYWLAGMSVFDAIGHSFSTVAIGGFSTHDQSMAYFDSHFIEAVAMVFMLLSGINFALHFLAWRSLSIRPYINDPEFRVYISILGIISLLTIAYLYLTGMYSSLEQAAFRGLFQAISIGTTAGFTTAEYHHWPTFLPILLLLGSFIGGCAGSTGGGMKVIRVWLLIKQGIREIRRLIHPNAIFPIKIGNKPLSSRVVGSVWGFFSLYVVCFCVMGLTLTGTGLDLVTAFSAVAACLNNLGPGLGSVGANYAGVNDAAKWVLCVAMLLGRLEIFTLLVLLIPEYWRR
jgi:trk system potassium uptake protein TrkH